MKYYTDEQIPGAVISGLRHRGIDVVSAPDVSMLGALDREHLELSHKLKRVIITQDTDFLRLHAQGFSHSGIIFASQNLTLGEIVLGIKMLDDLVEASEMENTLQFIPAGVRW